MTIPPVVRSVLFSVAVLTLFTTPSPAATVVGTLQDISIEGLNTKLTFWPATNVLLTPTGLNAGPPKTVNVASGQFSVTLEAGDYAVSLPLIPWRKPFGIAVFPTNGTVNITNLLTAPRTYTYTNNLNWTLNGTNIFFKGGNVGIGVTNPQAPLEISADIGAGKQLRLSATNPASAVGVEFRSPNSTNDWQLGVDGDVLAIGKDGLGDIVTLEPDGLVSAMAIALFGGATSLNNDGSAQFIGGNAVFGDNPLLHLVNNSADTEPTQLLLESSGEGSVGLQFHSGVSIDNWQISLLNDALRMGKVGGGDFLSINAAGRVSAPQGFAVDAALGISTNLAVLLPGPRTNTLVFTKGILTAIQ